MANAAFATETEVRDWLVSRRAGIGGSDAPAVCGVDAYKTPLEVYCEKTDDSEPSGGLPEDPAMRWGLLLEPSVARGYEAALDVQTFEPEPRTHPEFPFMRATPDRLVVGDKRIVQIKTASSRALGWGLPEVGQIPERVAVQVQHEMFVFGAEVADVACLIDGRDFRIYRDIRRDDSIIESLIDIESEFWQRVVNRDPPEPDFTHPATVELLSRIHRPTGPEVSLAEEFADAARAYLAAGEAIKEHERDRNTIKARLIHAMQDAAIAHVGGFTITRNERKRKEHTVKASTYVEFKVKAPKGEVSE